MDRWRERDRETDGERVRERGWTDREREREGGMDRWRERERNYVDVYYC